MTDQLVISTGKSRSDTKWRPQYLTWEEFTDRLKKPRRTAETVSQYWQSPDKDRGRIKDGPGFVAGFVRDGRRKRQNIDSRSMVTLDADSAGPGFLDSAALALAGAAYAIYSTHSHRPGSAAGKYRLIVPLDREATPDEYAAISRRIAAEVGMENFDRTTFEAHRLMYFPSCSKDADPVYIEGRGDPLSADLVLGSYADWHDVGQWPRHGQERQIKAASGPAADPASKQGVVGLFCRAYGIEEGIDTFLAEVYAPGGIQGRYSYTGGESVNGLQVWPDQGLAYSHQDSDPAATGHAYNIFDLVRVHKFGAMDENVKALEGAKLPSYLAMRAWAADLPEVKRLRLAELEADFDAAPVEAADPDAWKAELVLNPKTALPWPTPKNIRLILENGEFAGALAYDVFKGVEILKKDIPGLRRASEDNAPCGQWRGCDDAILRQYLGERYGVKGREAIMDAFTTVTRKNAYHPIKDYLRGLVWDGQERAETCLIDYLGAEDTEYTRQAARKMLLAAVCRIYAPGTKFDQMLVLIGPQECGKSEFLERIGRSIWFSDGLKDLSKTKDSGEILQAGWIFEIAELSAMGRSGIEEIKAFLSKTTDRYRAAYDRTVTEYPRQGVFFGTTNDRDFLKDPTGNRRFWPVEVGGYGATKKVPADVWHGLTPQVVDQIWAEVNIWHNVGETLKISAEAKRIAEEKHLYFTEDSGEAGVIQKWLDSPVTDEIGNPTGEFLQKVCAYQILVECIGKRKAHIRQNDAKAIIGILRKMPNWEEASYRHDFQKYGRQTTFIRKK